MIFLNVDNKRAHSLACNLLTPRIATESTSRWGGELGEDGEEEDATYYRCRIHQCRNIPTITSVQEIFVLRVLLYRLFPRVYIRCNRPRDNGFHIMRAIDWYMRHERRELLTRVERWSRPTVLYQDKNIRCARLSIGKAAKSARTVEWDRSSRLIVSERGNYVSTRGCTAGGKREVEGECMRRV